QSGPAPRLSEDGVSAAGPAAELCRSTAVEGAVKAIRLKRMGEDEYRTYRDAAAQGYAVDKQRSGDWVSRDALTLSLQAFHRSAPSGLQTPDQHLFTVHDAATDAKVGWLWYQVRDDGLYRSAYLCDIVIFDE